MLKTSEFSRVRSTSDNSDVFNSRDELYLVFTKTVNFLYGLNSLLNIKGHVTSRGVDSFQRKWALITVCGGRFFLQFCL